MTDETKENADVDTTSDTPVRPRFATDSAPTHDERVADERAVAEEDSNPAVAGVLETKLMNVFYGDFRAVADVSMSFHFNDISALIGPSGCGKSTVLRSLNRMNDLIPSARVEGEVRYHGANIYDDGIDPVEVRRRIGMVFQKPNPFPKSIFDNIAWGAKINGFKGSKSDMNDLVENALRQAALWDEVKDKQSESGLSLSGGQQQRLCIARAIATQPDVLLMDEPCSALDPIATLKIEELMIELKENYSIVIVTHNMQQAARVSDRTAFFNVELDTDGQRTGYLVEFSPTDELFTNPREKDTEDYITGRFG
ncbi:MAG: phosphate ABC transporter ATP-binding protein [Acidimicrobiia bacterium]|nr:phosphate ABC transporter ATP-binding protein [Acidimicrobiia bacterium]NNC75153.1 phosphate ABC transporter ATP-binding protein [Acidimicrobiia bacterium]